MGFWKVAGWVFFPGPSAVIAIASHVKTNIEERGYRAGERAATAKEKQRVENMVNDLKTAQAKLQSDKECWEFLIAVYAVGVATACADGNISEEELKDLEEYTAGIMSSKLPPEVKGIIALIKSNPPSFSTAMTYVKKVGGIDLKLFENVIMLVSASDGRVAEEETALLAAFRKAAA